MEHRPIGIDMKFTLKTNLKFYADDLDHAFLLLAKHFLDLHLTSNSGLEIVGEIELKKNEVSEGGC